MPARVAINGFGRIGRSVTRSAIERDADKDLRRARAAAVNLVPSPFSAVPVAA